MDTITNTISDWWDDVRDGIGNLPANAAQIFPDIVPVDNPNQSAASAGVQNVAIFGSDVSQAVTSAVSQIASGVAKGASPQLIEEIAIVGAVILVVLLLVNKAEAL